MKNRKILIYQDGKSEIAEENMCERQRGEAIVRVKACGVCGSDLPRIFKNRAYYYPIVLGHEFSGVVEESENENLIGKRVSVFPILPCGKCEFCKKGLYANCVKYGYYGSRQNGGMQDYIAVKEENLVPLPDNVSFETGAMTEPAAVCLHAVKKAAVKPGESVAVYGAGTIGLLCAMWAKAFGASNVYVTDIDEKKLEFAKKLGFFAYTGERVQAVFERSGAGACVNAAIETADAFGRIVLVGNAAADVIIPAGNYAKILRKQLAVFGSWNSDFTIGGAAGTNDWAESVRAMSDGKIQPQLLITHKIALKDWSRAVEIMKNRQFFNKIMVVTDDAE